MTIPLTKITLLSFLPVLLVLSKRFSRGKYDVIKIENQPFDLECIVTGTKDELDNSKITWIRPDKDLPVHGKDVPIPPEGDSHANISVKKGDGKLISTLHVLRPWNFTILQHYQCEVTPSGPDEINQQSFAIIVLKEKAVPQMQLKTKLEPAKLDETVVLKCSVSYDNVNSNDGFDLRMSWKKDGELLINKTYEYKTGKNIERLRYSLFIKSFKDGGEYVCSWELKFVGSSISSNSTADLPILPYLPGSEVKEVFGILGNNVTLECDVVGYPIMFQWRDEMNNAIIGGDSRIRTEKEFLYIHDMNYGDRQKYKCLGIVGGNKPLSQTIILRVKGSSTSESGGNTGVVIGISVAVGVFVIAIMGVLVYLRWKRRRDETDYNEASIKLSPKPDDQEEE